LQRCTMLGSQLLSAAQASDGPLVTTLLSRKADPNERDCGLTALMFAANNGEQEMTWDLVQAGADLNAHDQAGTTALMMAARQGRAEVVQMLCGCGVDRGATDAEGATALSMARDEGHAAVICILEEEATAAPPDPEERRRAALARTEAARLEAEALAKPPPPPAPEAPAPGPDPYAERTLVMEHVASFKTSLSKFCWARYRSSVARLAGVQPSDVFFTPEPDSNTVRLLLRRGPRVGHPPSPISQTCLHVTLRQPIRHYSTVHRGRGGRGTPLRNP